MPTTTPPTPNVLPDQVRREADAIDESQPATPATPAEPEVQP